MSVGGKLDSDNGHLALALKGLEDARLHLTNDENDEVTDLLLEVEDVADRLSLLIRSQRFKEETPTRRSD